MGSHYVYNIDAYINIITCSCNLWPSAFKLQHTYQSYGIIQHLKATDYNYRLLY